MRCAIGRRSGTRCRGDEVGCWGEAGGAVFGVDEGPVFQVHVSVADEGVEDQAADEFGDPGLAGFDPEDLGEIVVTGFVVFLFGVDAEDLGEVLYVDALAVDVAVEALDGEGGVAVDFNAGGQSADVADGDELCFGDFEADVAGELHDGEFVFGEILKAG